MIEVHSKFDENVATQLLKLHFKRLAWVFVAFSILAIAIGVTCIISDESDLFFGIFLIILGIVFVPLVLLLSFASQNKMNKTMKLMTQETFNYFKFDKNKIYQSTVKGEDFRSSAEYEYSLLFKAYETRSHFFVYISKMQAHVIPKKDIVAGTSQQLSQLLLDKLGKKFKVLNIK